MTLRGIDVSNLQGPIDWAQVAASGVGFAWVKATEGIGFIDAYYTANHDAARRNGIYAGGYHFARPSQSDGPTQANRFCSVLGVLRPGDLAPVLDIEDTGGLTWPLLAAWCDAFCARVQARTGRYPVVYLNADFHDHLLPYWGGLGHVYPVWLAALTPQPPRPCLVWQHNWSGQVPGITGDVDLNAFLGDGESLHRLAGITDTPAPTAVLEDDMRYQLVQVQGTDPQYACCPGTVYHVTPEQRDGLIAAGLVVTDSQGRPTLRVVNAAQFDQLKSVLLASGFKA